MGAALAPLSRVDRLGHNRVVTSYFDDAAATWDDDPAKVERARTSADLIRAEVRLDRGDRVLEVGGGTGRLSLFLADAVGRVTVTDASSAMVEEAARNIARAGLTDRFEAVHLDLTADEPTLEPASHDGAWTMLTLHHVDAVDLALRRLHAALRPGGWVAIIDLDEDPHGAFHRHNPDFDGHHGFGRERFAAQLAEAGFTDVRMVDAGVVDKEVDGQHGAGGTVAPFPLFLAIGRA